MIVWEGPFPTDGFSLFWLFPGSSHSNTHSHTHSRGALGTTLHYLWISLDTPTDGLGGTRCPETTPQFEVSAASENAPSVTDASWLKPDFLFFGEVGPIPESRASSVGHLLCIAKMADKLFVGDLPECFLGESYSLT